MRGNDSEIQAVVDAFWGRRNQIEAQHKLSGVQGGAARSGTHMAAIQDYVRRLFIEAGLPPESVLNGSPSLPGFFRRSKSWDVVVSYRGVLVAAVELKSQVGSVGNNANNRIEEAIGNAYDIGAVQKYNRSFGSLSPWLAFVMVLEETADTRRELRPRSTVFATDEVFTHATYSSQYQTALSRFVSDGLYDAGWFLTTAQHADGGYGYAEPLKTATSETFKGLVAARVEFVLAALD